MLTDHGKLEKNIYIDIEFWTTLVYHIKIKMFITNQL